MRDCVGCGKQFDSRFSFQVRCETGCWSGTCGHCGVLFRLVGKAGEEAIRKGRRYCSNDCSNRNKWKASPYPKDVAMQRIRFQPHVIAARYREHLRAGYRLVPCPDCDGAFDNSRGRKRCEACANVAAGMLVDRCRTCKVCGKAFVAKKTGGKAQTICSEECRWKSMRVAKRLARRTNRRIHGHEGTHRKRARKAGVPYEPVSALKVFQRDGWRCQICGRSTPKSRRGTCHANAPELDHRVPMSKGGAHSYENIQTACRSCNGAKGDRSSVGQLPLLAA